MHQITNINHTLHPWYAIHCKPLKERQAAVILEQNLGLTVYLAEVKRSFRGEIQRAPLFPRYLFVQADLEAVAITKINAVPGILRLVAFDEEPQPVSATIIETLRERVDKLNAQGGLPNHSFHPGDAVWLKEGPLRGLEGLFVGPMKPSERVRVLIDFLGQLREAEVNRNMVEPASSELTSQRKRRTRGKGRKIRNQ